MLDRQVEARDSKLPKYIRRDCNVHGKNVYFQLELDNGYSCVLCDMDKEGSRTPAWMSATPPGIQSTDR